MSRIALDETYSGFNKRHEVSRTSTLLLARDNYNESQKVPLPTLLLRKTKTGTQPYLNKETNTNADSKDPMGQLVNTNYIIDM